MLGDTIIGTSLRSKAALKALVSPRGEREAFDDADHPAAERLFKIRAADSEGRRSSASVLVTRRYMWRGYRTGFVTQAGDLDGERITLIATEKEETVGTISIGFDGSRGLQVDELFAAEVDDLRAAGLGLCEFTKLAMDSFVGSKRILAALFHVAHIYAHRLHGVDSLLIEVNPRHVRFYEKMLGFRVVSAPRLNRRVDAAAVLMCLDFAHAHEQIKRCGGRARAGEVARSLYPYFFSVDEEAGIVGRLRRHGSNAPGAALQ